MKRTFSIQENMEMRLTESNNLDNVDVEKNLSGVVSPVYAKAIETHNENEKRIEDEFKDSQKVTDELIKENQPDSHDNLKHPVLKKLKLEESLFESIEEALNVRSRVDSFHPWGSAKDVWELVISAPSGKERFVEMLEEMYPDGIDETELNDFLWFERDWILATLGIEDPEEV